MPGESPRVFRRNLHAREDAAVVGAVVAVVEQADVPALAHWVRKRSRAPGRSGNAKR